MTAESRTQVTELLTALGENPTAAEVATTSDDLMRVVYPSLHRLARRYFSGESAGHTLQPTALVHEAYVKLVDSDVGCTWQGRTHFFAVGARAMRQVLVDHARGRNREKRGGNLQRVTLAEGRRAEGRRELDMDELLALHAALDRLAELDSRQAEIVEMRFFGGLTVAEVAEKLGVSKRTVEGDWAHAKVWLERELEQGSR